MNYSSDLDGGLSRLSLYSMDEKHPKIDINRCFTLSEPWTVQARKCFTVSATLIIDKAFSVTETFPDVAEEVVRRFSEMTAKLFPTREIVGYGVRIENIFFLSVFAYLGKGSVKPLCIKFLNACAARGRPIPNGFEMHVNCHFNDSQKIW